MKSYRPLRERIIVKVKQGEEVSKGGIIVVAEGTRESMAREEGTVVAIGPSAFHDTDGHEDLKIGDFVVFARYSGKTLGKDKDGFELRVMQDIDICAVIEETKEEKVNE